MLNGGAMLISCDTCAVRGDACGGCMVNALFEIAVEGGVAVSGRSPAESAAIETLTRAGFEVTVLESPRDRRSTRSRRSGRRRAA